jgi:uroporphyrinogen-III decarboxylase
VEFETKIKKKEFTKIEQALCSESNSTNELLDKLMNAREEMFDEQLEAGLKLKKFKVLE